jgi:hypothetical protein
MSMIASSRSPYAYHEEMSTVVQNNDGPNGGFGFRVEEGVFDNNIKREHTFMSKDIKLVLPMYSALFHLMFDTLGVILNEYKKNKDLVFILDWHRDSDDRVGPLAEFVIGVLDSKGIKYHFVDLKNSRMLINRFYFVNNITYGFDKFKAVSDWADQSGLIDNAVPYKKIYLSRSLAAKSQDFNRWKRPDLIPGSPFADDNRIDNEDLIEEYFKSHGYEIVYAENMGSYEDRIKYFSSVEVLVSPTGAGLCHSIFMSPRSRIVELAIPMGATEDDGHWSFTLHELYKKICLARGVPHITIASMRSANDIIASIECNDFLKKALFDD